MIILFWFRKSRVNGLGTIVAEVKAKGHRVKQFSTGIKLKKCCWNSKKQEATLAAENIRLQQIKQGLQFSFLQLQQAGHKPTPEIVVNHWKEGQVPKYVPTLLEFYRGHIQHRWKLVETGKLKPRTVETDMSRLKLMATYLKETRKQACLVSDVTLKFAVDFLNWLQSQPTIRSHNYCMKQLQTLKTIMKRAQQQGHIRENPLALMALSYQEPAAPLFIPATSLKSLKVLMPQLSGKLQQAAALCLFQCFTGMAWADVETFSPEQHMHQDGGIWWIEKKRVKTGGEALLPLFPEAKMVLQQYGWKLPLMAPQTYNKNLKVLGDLMGLAFALQSHICRKTAGDMWLQQGFDFADVARMLGHKSQKTTERIYARVRKPRLMLKINPADLQV